MFALTAATHIYLYRSPCDMRKSFDGLSGLIRSELGADPLSGSLFVFCNRRRNMVKLLYWDRDGFALWYKRLEGGCFSLPPTSSPHARIDRLQLTLLLEGVIPKKVKGKGYQSLNRDKIKITIQRQQAVSADKHGRTA